MVENRRRTQIPLNIIFTVMSIIILYPFLQILIVSFTDENTILNEGYRLLPSKWSLEAYKYVFKNPKMVLDAYKVTFVFSIIYMVISVVLQACLAFALTNKKLKGRRKLSFMLYFTMLFSGGLVPTYLLITQYLHLDDTIWVYIIPGLISPWNVFMIRTQFQTLPDGLYDAARIDGASQYRVLFQIVMPLSTPVLATVALNSFLGKWNDWNTAMLYINKDSLISLQYLLQRIMQNIQMLQNEAATAMGVMEYSDIPSETVRMALAIVVAGPALFVFPFFQKYFVKGLTVGSVKG